MRFKEAIGLSLLAGSLVWGTGLVAAQNAANVTPIAYGSSIQGQVMPGQPVQEFSFDGKAGDVLTASLSSDTTLLLTVRPANLQSPFDMPVPLHAGDAPTDGTQLFRVALRTDGQYLITIQGSEPNTNTIFTLALTQSGTTLNDGAQLVRLTPENPVQTLTFTGTAGEQVKLNLQVVMAGQMSIGPGGDVLPQQPSTNFSGPGDSDGLVLQPPVTGELPQGDPGGLFGGAPGIAAVSVSQNGAVLAQVTENPDDLLPDSPTGGQSGSFQSPQDGQPMEIVPDLPKTTLEFTIPTDGTVEVVVTANSFPQPPENLMGEIPQVIERQVYIEQVEQ